jgi:hypothetical protein
MRQQPRSHCTVAATVALALVTAVAVMATPALAATGSVYFDANNNVGAGHDFFSGTTPTGNLNVGLGYSVMPALTSAAANVAIGDGALSADTLGNVNTAIGYNALTANTTGGGNVATGAMALDSNTSGNNNVATGNEALSGNTTGRDNSATGLGALIANTNGHDNTASGYHALLHNTTGDSNIALGSSAGGNLTTGSNNIDIASPGVAGESGTIRIGTAARQNAAYLAGVFGRTIGGPTKAVVVNKNGRLGTKPAPAAPLRDQTQAIKKLRDRVGRLATEVQRLRKER